MKIKNIAIIAHVDHGKTTLVDKILHHCALFRDNQDAGELILDNNDLERERGITIKSQAVTIPYRAADGQDYLLNFVDILQQELIRAGVLPEDYDFDNHKKLVPMQPGDVPVTYADTSALERDFGFKPKTSLREGLRKFAEWYKEYYNE